MTTERERSIVLDERATIEVVSLAQDAMGQNVETWATLATVWAEVVERSVGQQERFTGSAYELAEREAIFTIRHRSDISINVRNRIRLRDDTYRVIGLRVLGRRRYDQITAVAEVPA